MSRSRRTATVVIVTLTVITATVAVSVLGWVPDSLENASWLAGVLGLAFGVVALLGGRGDVDARAAGAPRTRRTGAPDPGDGGAARRRWTPPRTRSGAGAALALGGLGATLIVLMVLGAIVIIAG